MSGTSAEGIPARLGAVASIADENFQQRLFAPAEPTGNTGAVTIVADSLIARDRGEVTVQHQGTGNAGTLQIEVDRLQLDRGGRILASTESGNGGNVAIDANGTLQLRGGSQINVEARGDIGDGGNLTIDAGAIAAVENSDIIANAQSGAGGRIAIITSGLFGTTFRERLTPQSDITATSALGPLFDGIVAIAEPDIDPSDGLANLSVALTDISSEFDRNPCKDLQGSQFIFTGRGGLPLSPFDDLRDIEYENDAWIAVAENASEALSQRNGLDRTKAKPLPRTIVEATSWQLDRDGKVELLTSNQIDRQRWHREDRCNATLPSEPAMYSTRE